MSSSVMIKFSEYLTWSWQEGDTPFHVCCLQTMEDCDQVSEGQSGLTSRLLLGSLWRGLEVC